MLGRSRLCHCSCGITKQCEDRKNYLMWKVGCLDDPHRALVPIDGGDAQVLVGGRVARVDRDARCGCLDGERQENEEGDG